MIFTDLRVKFRIFREFRKFRETTGFPPNSGEHLKFRGHWQLCTTLLDQKQENM